MALQFGSQIQRERESPWNLRDYGKMGKWAGQFSRLRFGDSQRVAAGMERLKDHPGCECDSQNMPLVPVPEVLIQEVQD